MGCGGGKYNRIGQNPINNEFPECNFYSVLEGKVPEEVLEKFGDILKFSGAPEKAGGRYRKKPAVVTAN